MKAQLTKEQSQHLFELGISKEKATGIDYSNPILSYIERVFTLTDLLEILPKEIKFKNTVYSIEIGWNKFWDRWVVRYENTSEVIPSLLIDSENRFAAVHGSEEINDALYWMLCRLIELNFLNI